MRTIRGWKALPAIAVLAVAAGCSTTVKVGQDFSFGEFVSRAKHGETTKAQVQEWLGPPMGQGMVLETDGQKNDQWTYYHGSGRIPSGTDTQFKLLQVKFNPEGRMISYTWSGEPAKPAADKGN